MRGMRQLGTERVSRYTSSHRTRRLTRMGRQSQNCVRRVSAMFSVRVLAAIVTAAQCVLAADPCYGRGGVARRCDPPLVNAAAGRTAECAPRHHCDGGIGALTDLRAEATCWNWTGAGAALNLTLGLGGGRYEVRYVGVRLCAPADGLSVVLYKSADRGRRFAPFHFHSTRCEGAFGRRQDAPLTRADEHEARCTAPGAGSRVLAFSALEGRPSAPRFDASPVLQDWVTATDIRVSLVRHAPGAWVGVSDVSVGGRCKCNGHASECGEGGACLCRHNTAGRECERCRPFHFDRPWGRATEADAKECVGCRCHGHSRACRFNVDLYRMSGFESGGVCLRCRHRTAGRHCETCAKGYYRDADKPIEHRKACRACECHPVGSSSDVCHQPSGQCPCKEGVTGRACDRCAKGYLQSRSALNPCVRASKNKPPKKTGEDAGCGPCPASSRKGLNFRRYCSSDYAIQADVTSKESVGDWVRHSVHVRHVFKAGPARLMRTGGPQSLWVPRRRPCTCPRLRPNRSYLVMGKNHEGGRYSGLHATGDSTVLEWREGRWPRRMRRLQERQRRGECGGRTPGPDDDAASV